VTARTGTSRTGLTRVELVATVTLVTVFVALACVLLLPSWRSAAAPGATGVPTGIGAGWDAVALEPDRRAADLPPCPDRPALDRPAPAAGPLAGLRLPCLGAPGVVAPAAGYSGRDVLLNVWASWCAPCRAELPVLAQYAAEPGAVPVLEVDERDLPKAALALLADLQVKLPTVADPTGELTSMLHSPPGLPISYLLRADGSVVPVTPPGAFGSAGAVAETVARLRAPAPGPAPAGS
jgi:thiol-disulfide isomerase/thioredoxin